MILSLTSFFSVEKGTEDIIMVFEVTVGGINDSLWDNNFMIAVTGSLFIMMVPKMHMVDLNFG